MTRPLKLLLIAPFNPWPADHGGKIRMWQSISGLASLGLELHVWYASIEEAASDVPPKIQNVDWNPYEARIRKNAWHKLIVLCSRLPESAWQVLNTKLRRELREGMRHYDAVVLEQAHMAAFVARIPHNIPVIVIAQNVEHDLMRQIAHSFPRVRTRLRYRLDAAKMRYLERKLFSRAQLVVAMSPVDKSKILKLSEKAHVVVHPNGVDLDYFAYRLPRQGPGNRLVMTGTLGYAPNLDAAKWIYHEILPGIRKQIPDAHISLVGSLCPSELRDLHDPARGFDVIGYVDDVRPYMQAADVFLMPLRMGGGTRLKALQAMSAGVPIVSTSLGVEGIDLGTPPAVRIGETAEGLIKLCILLLESSTIRREQAARARTVVEENYSWSQIVGALHTDLVRAVG